MCILEKAALQYVYILGITGFLDFVHHPVIKNTKFHKQNLVPSLGEGWEAPILLGVLARV
jgi:hypothetical protein